MATHALATFEACFAITFKCISLMERGVILLLPRGLPRPRPRGTLAGSTSLILSGFAAGVGAGREGTTAIFVKFSRSVESEEAGEDGADGEARAAAAVFAVAASVPLPEGPASGITAR